ncbi:MAG: hypothetical protein EXR69_07710 [Myxococcales bacterium]|nr:hypothetical protein [Myxococcales bacterium]
MKPAPVQSAAPAIFCLLLLPLAAIASGCTGAKADDPAEDDTSALDDTAEVDEFAPSITVVNTVDCAEYQSAGEAWDLVLAVDDPQGADTVEEGTVAVLSEEGGEMAVYVLACGGGTCVGSFRAEYDGIGCSLQGSVTLRFIVVDINGNSSEPYDYPT